jgi:hypothetical protein
MSWVWLLPRTGEIGLDEYLLEIEAGIGCMKPYMPLVLLISRNLSIERMASPFATVM